MKKEKSLKDQASEIGKEIFNSFQEAQKEALEKETKEKKVKKAKAEKHVVNIHPLNKEYGISTNAFDNMVGKDFSPENVKQYVGILKDEEAIKEKNALFFRALVGTKLYPQEQSFAYTLKALSEGTDADGGYLVTPEYRTNVLRQLHNNGIMRPEVNVIPTNTDSVLFNYEDGRPLVSWGSENTTISTTTAGLGQKTISVHRMNSRMYLSRELVADSNPSIMDWIQSEFVESVLNEEDAVIIGGSGTGRPYGIQTRVTSANVAAGTFTFEDLVDLQHSLPVQYRKAGGGKLYMNDLTLRDIRKLKDDQGMPIYLRSLDGAAPDTVLGIPTVVHNNFTEGYIYYADLKRVYTLLDRQRLSVETSTEADDTFKKHQVQIKITERIGGDTVRTDAIKLGTGFSA